MSESPDVYVPPAVRAGLAFRDQAAADPEMRALFARASATFKDQMTALHHRLKRSGVLEQLRTITDPTAALVAFHAAGGGSLTEGTQ